MKGVFGAGARHEKPGARCVDAGAGADVDSTDIC